MIDILLTFFMATKDEETLEIEMRHWVLALNYLRSWFFLDIISVIPFDEIFNGINVNRLSRFIRFGKISKLVRMARIINLIKMGKIKNTLLKSMGNVLKIGIGLERLMLLLLKFIILVHVISCIWIFIASIDECSKGNWIY